MTTKEIAKCIRTDLKTTFGKEVKFSVRTNYFSMGSEINIYVKAAKEDYFKEEGNHLLNLKDEVIDKIKNIVEEYQIVESDPYYDYYNTNFYNNISCWNDKLGKSYIERLS